MPKNPDHAFVPAHVVLRDHHRAALKLREDVFFADVVADFLVDFDLAEHIRQTFFQYFRHRTPEHRILLEFDLLERMREPEEVHAGFVRYGCEGDVRNHLGKESHGLVGALLILATEVLVFECQEFLAHDFLLRGGIEIFLHIDPVALRRRNSARRDVWLIEKALVAECTHFVPNGRTREAELGAVCE